jgi:hypothetical protein
MLARGEQISTEFREVEQQYQSISPLAIVSIGLAICAGLALAHPLMWWLPIIAVFVSLAALRGIARSGGAQTGKRLAIVAICLALFFLTWAITRMAVGRQIEERQARVIADGWLQVVQRGDLYTAHQWTVSGYRRQPEGTVLSNYYEHDAEVQQEFERFHSEMLMEALQNVNSDDRFECRGVTSFEGPRNRRVMGVAYDRCSPDGGPVDSFTILVQRNFDSDMLVTLWQILAVND